MVQASWVPLLAATPAVVVGFASTVSTVAGRGNDVTVTTISHPGLVAAVAASSERPLACFPNTWQPP